jgi:hypothetical protein
LPYADVFYGLKHLAFHLGIKTMGNREMKRRGPFFYKKKLIVDLKPLIIGGGPRPWAYGKRLPWNP